MLLSKLKFSTQKHRFRINGLKREMLFFRNQQDSCVLPCTQSGRNLYKNKCYSKNFKIYIYNVIGEILYHHKKKNNFLFKK